MVKRDDPPYTIPILALDEELAIIAPVTKSPIPMSLKMVPVTMPIRPALLGTFTCGRTVGPRGADEGSVITVGAGEVKAVFEAGTMSGAEDTAAGATIGVAVASDFTSSFGVGEAHRPSTHTRSPLQSVSLVHSAEAFSAKVATSASPSHMMVNAVLLMLLTPVD
jgi:hypothetical protein